MSLSRFDTRPNIPDYELLRVVGRGAYGDVWLARGVTGVLVAIKTVWRSRFSEPQPYEREFSGLCSYAQLSRHEPTHLALLHVGRNDQEGYFYYVMEPADDVETGRSIDPARYSPLTLKRLVDAQRRIGIPHVITHAIEITRALEALHTRGLVHRDIKPSNVLIIDGRPKLADVGLISTAEAAITFVGTEGFVPPEGPGTPQADIYSLGKVLYELATGRDRHDYPQLPNDLSLRDDRRELLELNEVIIRACDPHPSRRHADATALLQELLLLQAGRSVRRLRRTERALSRTRRGLIAASVAMVLCGAGVFYERQRAESEATARRAAENDRDLVRRQTSYSATLAEAQHALEHGEPGRARQLLFDLVPAGGDRDLRDFEWHALMNEARGDPAIVLQESGPPVTSLQWSPDRRVIAVGSGDAKVRLFNAEQQRLEQTVDGVHRLAGFSPDGQWMLGTGPDFRLRRWNLADGQSLPAKSVGNVHRPVGAQRSAARAAFFADGAGERPHRLCIHDFDADRTTVEVALQRICDYEVWEFFRAAVDPELRTAVVVLIHGRRQLARWRWHVVDLQAGEILHTYETGERLTAVAVSHDGRRFALLRPDPDLLSVADTRTGHEVWRRRIEVRNGDLLSFNPDSTVLVVGGRNAALAGFDASSGERLGIWRGHSGSVAAIAWADDSHLISASTAGDVRWWQRDLRSHRSEARLAQAGASGSDRRMPVVSEDGSRLGITTPERELRVFELNTFEQVAVQPDVSFPLRLDADNMLWWVNSTARVRQGRIGGAADQVRDVDLFGPATLEFAISDDLHRWFAASNRAGEIVVYDMVAARELRRFPAGADRPLGLAIDSAAQRLTVAGDHEIAVYDVSTGELVARTFVAQRHESTRVAPSGRFLAFNVLPDQLQVRSLPDLALLRTFPAGWSNFDAMAFSPEGGRLVIGNAVGELQIYDTADWRQITTLSMGDREAAESVLRLQFSPNGRSLVALSETGRVRVWRW